ncbi:C1q-like domain-containing protein [Dyadobacter sp. 3J3]|uniref:C1q-like domain-containing protein n=1 Tax=Dyadobacter sp. 3J3 TaxID=2606600 RepID=UPI0013581302|nr:hypothetical protein [Dyadobacter sp. 3J3]
MKFRQTPYNPLAAKTMSSFLIVSGMLLSAQDVAAQVKIGTNPTTINAANNLEVESSTAGNKVSIDKETGKMTIADGSQGNGKVLTSDANGVATWETGTNVSCNAFEVAKSISSIAQGPAFVLHPFNSLVTDIAGAYDAATGIYTIPVRGTYIFTATAGEGNSTETGRVIPQFLSRHLRKELFRKAPSTA